MQEFYAEFVMAKWWRGGYLVTAHNAEVGRPFLPPLPHSSARTPEPSAQAWAPSQSRAGPALSPWYRRGFRGDFVGESRQTGGNLMWKRGFW